MQLHKQKLVKFGFSALSAIILTACGSGGASGNGNSAPSEHPAPQILQPSQPQQPTKQTNQPTQLKTETAVVKPTQPSQPTAEMKQPQSKAEVKPETPAQPTQPKVEQTPPPKTGIKPEQPKADNSTGAYSSVKDKKDSEDLDIQIHSLNQFNVNKISIEGVEIDVDSNDYLDNTWASFSVQNVKRDVNICCEKYNDVHFGIVSSQEENSPDFLFYNGNPTQSMPNIGTASYQGHTIFHDSLDDTKLLAGKSEFTVNFAEKKLNGTLTAKEIKPVNIVADIQHNSFTGSATSDDFSPKTKVQVEGKFFGENAKELGGIAESHDDVFGAAFGAKKQ